MFDEKKHPRDNKGQFAEKETKEYRQNTSYSEILQKDKKTKNLDSAVMNKYSSVRKKVEKIGYAITYVNDGDSSYSVKIIKSDDDFEYEILRELGKNE